MNNRWALGTGLLILGIFLLDRYYLDWNLPLFIGIQLTRVIEWMAFWR